jgi:hypothetical protein
VDGDLPVAQAHAGVEHATFNDEPGPYPEEAPLDEVGELGDVPVRLFPVQGMARSGVDDQPGARDRGAQGILIASQGEPVTVAPQQHGRCGASMPETSSRPSDFVGLRRHFGPR